MRIGAADQIALLLQNERCVELSRSSDDQFRRRPRCCKVALAPTAGEWLAGATVGAEHIVGGDSSTTKPAVDRLHLHSLAAEYRRGHSVTHASGHQVLEMDRERVSRMSPAEAKTILGLYSTDRIRICSNSVEIEGTIWRGRGFFAKSKIRQRIVLRIGTSQE